jgi:hypothetical protein
MTIRRCVVEHCPTQIVGLPGVRLCNEHQARARRKLRTVKVVLPRGWEVQVDHG